MKFSIIIPTLNEARGIRNHLLVLQALRSQCEIIIADGGSTDNTEQLAAPLVDLFIHAPTGRARQMNAAAEAASGEILLFLHADTFLPDQALLLIQRGLDSACWGRFDIQLSGTHPMLTVIAAMMNWRSRFTGIATGDQVIFMSRQAFLRAGKFPEIALMEDIAISKKLRKLGKPLCLKARVTSSGRRWEKFGILKTIALMWWLRLLFFLGADPPVLSHLYSNGKFL